MIFMIWKKCQNMLRWSAQNANKNGILSAHPSSCLYHLKVLWWPSGILIMKKMAEEISFHSALCHSPKRNKNSSLFPSAINCNGTPPGGDGPVPVELNLYTSFQPSLRSHGTSQNCSELASKSSDSPNLSKPPLTKMITLIEEMMFFCISGGLRLMLQSNIQTPSPSFWKMVMMLMILF